MLGDVRGLTEQAITALGYPGLLALMLAENLFPPIPSEVVLPLAGFFVSRGELRFAWALVVATAGSLLGALPGGVGPAAPLRSAATSSPPLVTGRLLLFLIILFDVHLAF